MTLSRDSPASLKSSDIGPVEASIEDLMSSREPLLEIDAAPPSSSNLAIKLAQEYNYHKFGSRIDEPELVPHSTVLPQQPASSRLPGDVSSQGSSVKSWAKPTPYLNPEEEAYLRSAAASSSFDGFGRPENQDHLSWLDSEYNRPPHPLYDRMKSCPEGGFPGTEPLMLDSNPGLRCSAPVICPPSDSGAGTGSVLYLSVYFINPELQAAESCFIFLSHFNVALLFWCILKEGEALLFANIIIAFVVHYGKQCKLLMERKCF